VGVFKMSLSASAASPTDTVAFEDKLACLEAGCWVKVGNKGTDLFWAEIKALEGNKITALVQQTYDSAEKYGIASGTEIKFDKKLVCATGCDKYCFC